MRRNGTAQVGGDDRIDLGRRHVLQPVRGGDAGVVDEHIQRPDRSLPRIEAPGDAARIGHVDGDGNSAAAEAGDFGDEVLDPVGPAGRRATQAPRAARDRANPSPSPLEAPVTSNRTPVRSCFCPVPFEGVRRTLRQCIDPRLDARQSRILVRRIGLQGQCPQLLKHDHQADQAEGDIPGEMPGTEASGTFIAVSHFPAGRGTWQVVPLEGKVVQHGGVARLGPVGQCAAQVDPAVTASTWSSLASSKITLSSR